MEEKGLLGLEDGAAAMILSLGAALASAMTVYVMTRQKHERELAAHFDRFEKELTLSKMHGIYTRREAYVQTMMTNGDGKSLLNQQASETVGRKEVQTQTISQAEGSELEQAKEQIMKLSMEIEYERALRKELEDALMCTADMNANAEHQDVLVEEEWEKELKELSLALAESKAALQRMDDQLKMTHEKLEMSESKCRMLEQELTELQQRLNGDDAVDDEPELEMETASRPKTSKATTPVVENPPDFHRKLEAMRIALQAERQNRRLEAAAVLGLVSFFFAW